MSTYRDELKFVAESDDNLYPGFLFTTMKNDFEDNYYEKSITDNLSSSIRGLRRRYSNFFEYADAIRIYNEYMDALVDKYGSMSIIRNALKNDLLEDPVPAKPKLKNNRKNREFLRAGVVPSKKVEKDVTDEDIRKIARSMYPDKNGDSVDEEKRFDKLDKSTRKMIKRQEDRLAGQFRRENMYRSNVNNNGCDFIVEFINNANKGYYDEGGQKQEESILDIIKEDDRYANIPPELIEDEFKGNTQSYYNGRLVSAKELQKIQIWKELYGAGIDVIGRFGKSMNKQAVKMIRDNIGDTEPMTKKELKKLKKRQKKEGGIIERRKDADATLQRALLGNKIDFSKSDDALLFRLKDVYKD